MSAPVLKKVHTFADDLNLVRSERGITTKKSAPVEQKIPARKEPGDQVTISKAAGSGPKKITTTSSGTLKPSANDLPATIITDQRGKRFNLTSEMSSAIGEWWNEKVQSVKKSKKKNLYGLPAAERRKGVVTAATTHTGRHAASDYQAVVDRVKAKPEPAVVAVPDSTPVAPIREAAETPTDWETAAAAPVTPFAVPTTDEMVVEDEAFSNSSAVQVTDITYRQPRIEPTVPDYISDETEEEVEEVEEFVEDIEETTAPAPEEEVSYVATRIDPPTPRQFEKITPVAPMVAAPSNSPSAFTLLSEVPAPVLQSRPDYVKTTIASRKEALANAPVAPASRLATLAPYLAGGAFVLVTVGTIAYFMMAGTSDMPPTADTTLPTDSVGTTNNPQSFPTANNPVTAGLDAPNKTSLFNAIQGTANQGEGLQLVTPLAHDTLLPLGSRDILSLLNRQFAPAFIGSVTQVQVGMYREEPVIILTVSDINSARGSMFLWETSISQDLSPWFGVPLTTGNSQTGSQFVDSQSAGYDVRVLKDDIGAERITYGIVGQSTVIITTNSTAFLNITENYNLF